MKKMQFPAAQLKNDVRRFCEDTHTSPSVREAVSEISKKIINARILIAGSFYIASEVLTD